MLDGFMIDSSRLNGFMLDGSRLDSSRLNGFMLDGSRLDGSRLDGCLDIDMEATVGRAGIWIHCAHARKSLLLPCPNQPFAGHMENRFFCDR
jgi:hypothetical protein